MAEIKTYPYYELNDFEKLRLAKEEKIPEDFKKMKEALKTDDAEEEDQEPLAFFATLTAFNFHPGSSESISFLKVLGKKAAELNQLFMS